jgi:hypothetical protein
MPRLGWAGLVGGVGGDDAFVHQVDLAVKEEKLGRNRRMEVEEMV